MIKRKKTAKPSSPNKKSPAKKPDTAKINTRNKKSPKKTTTKRIPSRAKLKSDEIFFEGIPVSLEIYPKNILTYKYFDVFTLYRRVMNSSNFDDTTRDNDPDQAWNIVEITEYVLFNNGVIKENIGFNDLVNFEKITTDAYFGCLEDNLIQELKSQGLIIEHKYTGKQFRDRYESNLEEYIRLLKLIEKEKKKGHSSKRKLKSAKKLKKMYLKWFEDENCNDMLERDLTQAKNEELLDDMGKDVLKKSNSHNNALEINKLLQEKANPDIIKKKTSSKNISKTTNRYKQFIKTQKDTSKRERCLWTKDRILLEKLIIALKSNNFINYTENVKDVISYHFKVACDRENKTVKNKHYIKWLATEYDICYLFKDLLQNKFGHISCIKHPFYVIEDHFTGLSKKEGKHIDKYFSHSQLKVSYSRTNKRNDTIKSKRKKELETLVNSILIENIEN